MFYLTIVNKISRHCVSWLARQYFVRPFTKTVDIILLDFLVTVKAAPHECVIRIGQP